LRPGGNVTNELEKEGFVKKHAFFNSLLVGEWKSEGDVKRLAAATCGNNAVEQQSARKAMKM